MALPKSFAKYQTAEAIRKTKRLMLAIDGVTDSGKTEFALSAPGPGIMVSLDRGLDGALKNENPPSWRNADRFAYKVIDAPTVASANASIQSFGNYWQSFKDELYGALDNPDARTIIVDGDSDGWELQRLAAFGKLTQVMPHHYTGVNAARRAMLARCWDAKKIVILTNKMKDEYVPKLDPDTGLPVFKDGIEVRTKTGKLVSQGFNDNGYMVQVRLQALYKDSKKDGRQYGVLVKKCKSNSELVGQEFWGDECNFRTLMGYVYGTEEVESWGEYAD